MIRNFFNAFLLLFTLIIALPTAVWAQSGEEQRVEFFSTNATMEDDPNQGVYNITIFSPDGQWKLQLNYHASSMFGTFGNADFRLDSDGKNYNYARNPKNDMVFYSFVDMNVSVASEDTLYRVKANCLTKNNTRFLVEATIDAPKPKSVLNDDLGYARVTTNSFYGSYVIKAENELYKLEYGVLSDTLGGTFYRADLLKPELFDKQAQKSIQITTATAFHTIKGDTTFMQLDLLSTNLVLYSLTMYNGPYTVEVKEERQIDILSGVVLQDLTAMYGCYQFGGQNDEYAVALAITPNAMESGRTEWTNDDIFLPYTRIIETATGESVDLFDIKASIARPDGTWIVSIEATSFDGILYHIRMFMQEGQSAPHVNDTVRIDFGPVAMLDYSKGIGTIGLGAVMPERFQMRCYFNSYNLNGEFTNEDFVLDMCDIMVVNEDRKSYVFHDAKYVTANMTLDPKDSVTHVLVNMYGVDDVLYQATMTIPPLQCLHDTHFAIDATDDISMVAIQEGTDGVSAEYTLQFQNMEGVYDDDYNILRDGFALSFYFGHRGTASIAGEYGYSAGTLAEDEVHTFIEKGCEVRIGAVAGTLFITPVSPMTVKIDFISFKTYLYNISFQFVGQNGALYSGEGENFLVCIDNDGNVINMDESGYSDIEKALSEQGFRVRKVLKDGKIFVEKLDRQYDLRGVKVKD